MRAQDVNEPSFVRQLFYVTNFPNLEKNPKNVSKKFK